MLKINGIEMEKGSFKMDKDKAVSILGALAQGVDPNTGEVLPTNSVYNYPDVIRALFFSLNELKASPKKKVKKSIEDKQKENIERGYPKNYGLKWSETDINLVIQRFLQEQPVTEIAAEVERKASSITSLLFKKGVIDGDRADKLKASLSG